MNIPKICNVLQQRDLFNFNSAFSIFWTWDTENAAKNNFFLLSRAQEHVAGDFPVYCSSPSVSHLPYTVPSYTIQPFSLRSQLVFQREPQTHLYNTHTQKKKSELLCISYSEIKLVLFLEGHIFLPIRWKNQTEVQITATSFLGEHEINARRVDFMS